MQLIVLLLFSHFDLKTLPFLQMLAFSKFRGFVARAVALLLQLLVRNCNVDDVTQYARDGFDWLLCGQAQGLTRVLTPKDSCRIWYFYYDVVLGGFQLPV